MPRKIILVDKKDRAIGTAFKMTAHRHGRLHRAFSLFVFNARGDVLLQQRATKKYHSGGLWTNTCCSHPSPGETVTEAAHRRLPEEMGFDCPLREIFSFRYRVKLDHGLIEHEFDHVFVGTFNGRPKANPDEVAKTRWISPNDLTRDMTRRPDQYTYWLQRCWPKLLAKIQT